MIASRSPSGVTPSLSTVTVRVSGSQLPALHAVVEACATKLGITAPQVYVIQEGLWNALSMKLAGKRMVVLYSGAVDSILLKGNMGQLTWLVGHEIGHHAAGHLDFVRRLAFAGGWFIWVMLWYSRRCELTCDRIGLYCVGNLGPSLGAVANLTVGAQLAETVSVDEAIKQWQGHRKEFFVRYRTIYSTHPHHLWRMEEMKKAAAEMGIAA